MTWDAPTDAPDDYRVTWKKSTGRWTSYKNDNTVEGGNAFPTGTSHTVTGLEEGTAYKARVRARYHNSGGKVEKSGPWSAAQEVTVSVTAAPTPTPTPQATAQPTPAPTPAPTAAPTPAPTMAAPTLSSTSPGELTVSWTAPSAQTRYYTIEWAKNADEFRAYTDPLGSPYGEDGVHFVNEFGIVRSSASPITITNLDRAVVYKARVTPHLRIRNEQHYTASTLRSGKPSPAATITINGAAFTEVAPAMLVSNFGQAVRSDNPVLPVAGSDSTYGEEAVASPFTTGSNSAGYNLDWVSLVINPAGGRAEAVSTVSVSIWTPDSNGMPGTKVYGLSYSQLAPSVLHGGPPHDIATRFQAPADAMLTADTEYLVVVESPESDVYYVSAVADTDEDADSAAGWSIGDGTVDRLGGTWRSSSINWPFRMAIAGSEVPTS